MDSSIQIFTKGVHNLLSSEQIAEDAAQDALGFVTQDGKIKLAGGRLLIGTDGAVGMIRGEWFGYTVLGAQIHFRKTETALQYLLNGVWTNILTGLTSGSEASFANYSSLAGAFTFFVTIDGYWKINNANPGSALQLYDSSKNFHGTIFIDKGRTILYRRVDPTTTDLTALYGSRIDPQNATVYTTIPSESLGTGDAVAHTFTPTLAFVGTARNSFGLQVNAPIGTPKAITDITAAVNAVLTIVGHGFTVGQKIMAYGVVGMTQINGKVLTITAVTDANTVMTSTDSSAYTAYSSGGNAGVVETFSDNFNGLLTSPTGGTGTINYVTGVVSLTFFGIPQNGATIYGAYQWENSNALGLTDFSKSATRLAAQGFQIPQDQGGDPIMLVLIGQDGAYYSLKQHTAYKFLMDSTDLNPLNEVYYQNMGVPSQNAGVSTKMGIVFINTADPAKPELTILMQDPTGTNIRPQILCAHFKFSNYDFSDCYFNTFERYVSISCKQVGSANNDRILLVDTATQSVDILPYPARMFAKDASENLYVGSPIVQSVHQILSGFDDLGAPIGGYWIGNADKYGALHMRTARWRFIQEVLKKFRRFRIKGNIDPNQVVEVWFSYDDAGFQKVGTIRGSGSYVDSSIPQTIGANFIGSAQIGGGSFTNIYPYFCEIKIKMPKFRKRTVKFVVTGIGYFDINFMSDWDIMIFEERLPKRFRQKQNVSLDGTLTNQ